MVLILFPHIHYRQLCSGPRGDNWTRNDKEENFLTHALLLSRQYCFHKVKFDQLS